MPNQDPHIAQELLLHQTFLRQLATDLVGREADDLVQDVWQRALERPPLDGRGLRSWLARVARNLAANRWRDEARRTEREERRVSEQAAGNELEARFELRKDLVGALDALGQSSRETILLRYFEGLAPRDIARRQGVPVATVKKRLRRGLGQLREVLDERCGGDRATWMSAVSALAVPASGSAVTGTLVIGGMAMGTMMKVSAAILVAAACTYFVARTPKAKSPPVAVAGPLATDVEVQVAAVVSTVDIVTTEATRRSPVTEELPGSISVARGTNVLRVLLKGIAAGDAGMTKVTLVGVDKRRVDWPSQIRDSWQCQGLTTDFDLDPFLARVAERDGNLRIDELEVRVEHPLHLRKVTRIPLSPGADPKGGQTVYEVVARMVRPVFWPGSTLTVRDAHTRAHLDDVELRFMPGAFSSTWGVNGPDTLLGTGLTSPITLKGAHKPDEPDEPKVMVAGLALPPAAGEPSRVAELAHRVRPERGIIVSARAPGYAWGSIKIDVTAGAERELLLEAGATLDVRMTNVQLDRYAALKTEAMLCVYKIRADKGDQYVQFERLDQSLEAEGLRVVGMAPGEYAVAVELGQRTVLARERVSLVAGQTRELILALPNAPVPHGRATLGGMISLPASGCEEEVQLQLYEVTTHMHAADVTLSLANMERIGGALPTWSFRVEDLPVGLYQAELHPFQKSWMIELPAGGREDVELVIPELAEVLVETVDAKTGEQVPLQHITYGSREVLPGQMNSRWTSAKLESPGRFRIWTVPGAVSIQTNRVPSHYGWRQMNLELVPGPQSVRLELGPAYLIRFEFRVDGVALPRVDMVWDWVRYGASHTTRPIDHGGRALGAVAEQIVEVTAPGVYEISFEGLGADRFLPPLPQRVDVRAGDAVDVIVELRRK